MDMLKALLYDLPSTGMENLHIEAIPSEHSHNQSHMSGEEVRSDDGITFLHLLGEDRI